MGDFNDSLSNDDICGQQERQPWLIRGFQEAVHDSQLYELPMEGYQFTWTKGVGTPDVKEGKLDQAFPTQNWLDVFPHNKLVNGVSDKSNHSPIWLRLNEWERRPHLRSFKFENASSLKMPGLRSLSYLRLLVIVGGLVQVVIS